MIDLNGQTFGRTTVIGYSHSNDGAFWTCVCSCGRTHVVSGSNLRNGSTHSCGCLNDFNRRTKNGTLQEQFDELTQKTETCWLWKGAPDRDGYGRIKHKGKRQRAHRVSWELVYGPIPDKLLVLHACDNPPCVNPAHLFLGTDQDNMTDKIQKGRAVVNPRDQSPASKLTAEQVIDIRRKVETGEYGIKTRLAAKYGIGKSTITKIINRTIWHHI